MRIQYQDMVSDWEEWTKGKIVPRVGEFVTFRTGIKVRKGKVLFVEYIYSTITGSSDMSHIKITLEWLPQ